MSVFLAGLATAAPELSISQARAAELAAAFAGQGTLDARLLPALFRRTQVQRRGSVLLDEGDEPEPQQSFFPESPDAAFRGPTTADRMQRYEQEAAGLALAAAGRALAKSRVAADEISHLVTVTCTGFAAPGVDVALVNQLGLPRTVERLHIGFMGCHGAINALRAAAALSRADVQSRVLVCAVELCSLHFQYGQRPDALVANSLFADGAAALVTSPDGRSGERLRLLATGSLLMPDAEGAMRWRIGDHGFEMTLSNRVPQHIAAHLRPWLEKWLRQHGLSIQQVGSWAIHPGGPRLLNDVAACLNLPRGSTWASEAVLAAHGNMSSPTVLFILERLLLHEAPRPIVALAFGPGLVAEAALFG